jgi:hypothetical protein
MTEQEAEDDRTVWCNFDPDLAIQVAVKLYGEDAASAAASCARAARHDGRERDYHFWDAIHQKLTEKRHAG